MSHNFRAALLLIIALLPSIVQAKEPSRSPLIARGDSNFPPYEFINAKGQPDGFNVDLLKAIAKQLQMDVDIGLDAWETVIEGAAVGDIHLVTGMIRSPEREKIFDFSITHAGVFYSLFVRKGSTIETIDDAAGKEILVHSRAYSHDWLLKRQITDRIIAVSTPQEALRLLAEGRHDCAIIERLSGLTLLNVLDIDSVVMAGPPLMCAPYAFSTKKGQDRLLAKLNQGIHLMHQNGTYEKLYRKWFSFADAQARHMALLRGGLLILMAVFGAALSIFIWNLSLKKRVQRRTAALATSEKRFHELCDLLPQIVFETASDGRVTYLNRAGFEMLGLDDQSIQDGIALSDVVPGALDPQFWTHSNDRNGKTTMVKGAGGNLFPALIYTSITVPGKDQRGLRGLLVDITIQKELEQQVIESQKLEALGRLAGGVAHDVNNIVTGISAYAQLIHKHPHRGDEVADSVEKILTGCDRATDLVRHFLVTAGQRQPQKEKVSLGVVVAQVFSLLRPTYGRSIIFENAIAQGHGVVWAEPALVFQVLMNLCVNGAQAMTGSGGSLKVGLVEAKHTHMGVGDVRLMQLFYVSDSGPGIEPDDKDRIFEPFFTTREQGIGTGIGLFVVRQALADMGGDIRIEGESGQGATFIVSLPMAA